MKIDLSLRCQHQLKLTPDIKQSLHFLQLSSEDLYQEVIKILHNNPFVEMSKRSHYVQTSYHDTIDELSIPHRPTLQEYLREQISFLSLKDQDKDILYMLLYGMDESGYWTLSEEDSSLFFESLGLSADQGKAYLQQLHELEPIGIGTRTLSERLLYLIQTRYSEHPLASQAHKVLTRIPTQMGIRPKPKDFARQCKTLGCDAETYPALITWLNHLITAFDIPETLQAPTQYIQADMTVKKINGHWVALPCEEAAYTFSLREDYAVMQQNWGDELKHEWEKARRILRHLDKRQHTLLCVTQCIVQAQQGFFSEGLKALAPLSMKHISAKLGMHESTISRVVHEKYLQSPQGILPLKSFFSHCVNTESGICSSMAVLAILKEYIDQENKDRPLSDTELTQHMKKQGIMIARRTIAKYRATLSIPPAHLRKHSLRKR